jgi:lipopolysaccharide/colanic/teichoic acid biosynthesis glycosyltransferase
MPNLLNRYPSDFALTRCSVRPGCTGIWQVSTACSGLIYEAPEYDLAYVFGGTLRLDAWILYRTARMWLTGNCVVDLDDVPRWVWQPRRQVATAYEALAR